MYIFRSQEAELEIWNKPMTTLLAAEGEGGGGDLLYNSLRDSLLVDIFPPHQVPLSIQALPEQEILAKEKKPPSPKKSYIASHKHTHSLSLPTPRSLPVTTALFTFPPFPVPKDLFSCVKDTPYYIFYPRNPRKWKASMQPRRSRFTELIDIPFPKATCSSSSDLSLDDVLRETEEHLLSQNRVLSWNGWDHIVDVQRRHSRPSRLRKKMAGASPRNVLGPSKGLWFWALLGYYSQGTSWGTKRRFSKGRRLEARCSIFLDGFLFSPPCQSPLSIKPANVHIKIYPFSTRMPREITHSLGLVIGLLCLDTESVPEGFLRSTILFSFDLWSSGKHAHTWVRSPRSKQSSSHFRLKCPAKSFTLLGCRWCFLGGEGTTIVVQGLVFIEEV